MNENENLEEMETLETEEVSTELVPTVTNHYDVNEGASTAQTVLAGAVGGLAFAGICWAGKKVWNGGKKLIGRIKMKKELKEQAKEAVEAAPEAPATDPKSEKNDKPKK